MSLPSRPFHILADRIIDLLKANGPTFVVSYLKEATRVMQAYVSGNQIRFSTELVGIKGGIPTIIPSELRPFLKGRDPKVIRGVLSLLQFYRVMDSRPVLKLGTIVRPFAGLSERLPDEASLRSAVANFSTRSRFILNEISGKDDHLLPFLTAGPSGRCSLFSMGQDMYSLVNKYPHLLESIQYFFDKYGALERS